MVAKHVSNVVDVVVRRNGQPIAVLLLNEETFRSGSQGYHMQSLVTLDDGTYAGQVYLVRKGSKPRAVAAPEPVAVAVAAPEKPAATPVKAKPAPLPKAPPASKAVKSAPTVAATTAPAPRAEAATADGGRKVCPVPVAKDGVTPDPKGKVCGQKTHGLGLCLAHWRPYRRSAALSAIAVRSGQDVTTPAPAKALTRHERGEAVAVQLVDSHRETVAVAKAKAAPAKAPKSPAPKAAAVVQNVKLVKPSPVKAGPKTAAADASIAAKAAMLTPEEQEALRAFLGK